MFSGASTAIVTPFKNGMIDYDSYEKIIEYQIENGISGIVPCGSTGESATMSHEEHKEFIEFTIEKVNKRVKVIAGTGSNNTAEAIELTKFAEEAGADGALLISPYYNKPTQEGLYQHYKAIADSVKELPLILYNVPGRTAKNMEASTVIRLSKHKNIVAVKEASGDLVQMAAIVKGTPDDFAVISGDDALTLPLYSVGGKGVISVFSNFAPKKMVELCKYCEEGNFDKAKKLHLELLDLFNAMFIETNPIPIKAVMNMLKFCNAELRLPLTEISKDNKDKLKKILKDNGIL